MILLTPLLAGFWIIKLLYRGIAVFAKATSLLPGRAYRWAQHEPNVALMLSVAAVLTGGLLNFAAIVLLYDWPTTLTVGTMTQSRIEPFAAPRVVETAFIFTLFLTTIGAIKICARGLTAEESMANFYQRWEQYSRQTAVEYYCRQLVNFFWSEVVAILSIVLSLAYWLTLGGGLLVFVVVPAATVINFLNGMYGIAQRSAHWWCFGVTLTITALSGLLFHRYFVDPTMVWLVALGTGSVSGLATEGLRRLGLWWGNSQHGSRWLTVGDWPEIAGDFAPNTWKQLQDGFIKGIANPTERFLFN